LYIIGIRSWGFACCFSEVELVTITKPGGSFHSGCRKIIEGLMATKIFKLEILKKLWVSLVFWWKSTKSGGFWKGKELL